MAGTADMAHVLVWRGDFRGAEERLPTKPRCFLCHSTLRQGECRSRFCRGIDGRRRSAAGATERRVP